MTGLKEEFARQLQRKGFVMGHSEQKRQATKQAVAKAVKRGTKATERSSTLWSSVRKEAAIAQEQRQWSEQWQGLGRQWGSSWVRHR